MENPTKVVIRGDAMVHSASRNVKAPMRGKSLEKFDGVSDDAEFSEYFHEGPLLKAGITGGYMEFVFDKEANNLFAETTYQIERRLTPEEETALIEYTQGQWSDGIGEGFEQNEERGAYISAWHAKQDVELIYK